MRRENTNNTTVHKDVVIIGNGPSGIALSYMLSGYLPHVNGSRHPDEMLSARLQDQNGQCLVDADLGHLASGLEGRSTNPVSLLLDALLHPCADLGLEMTPLAEFSKVGRKIDHIVLGKGPPGGSWHTMDPHILTLSLSNWMALPGLPFPSKDSREQRAFACDVAKYYVQYVQEMGLSDNFQSGVLVTHVKPVADAQTNKPSPPSRPRQFNNRESRHKIEIERNIRQNDQNNLCLQREIIEEKSCLLSSAIKYILRTGRKNKQIRCCKRPRDQLCCNDQSPTRKIIEIALNDHDFIVNPKQQYKKDRSISLCCDSSNLCDHFHSRNKSNNMNNVSYTLRNSYSLDFTSAHQVPVACNQIDNKGKANWIVETCDMETGEITTFTCTYLVLANGASDKPNRLEVDKGKDPEWLVHDLRSLESLIDNFASETESGMQEQPIDPVVVIGAGLSAADAVIAARERNIPVIHVFRNKSADLNRQLPENMYPEYHKVSQMMQDGGSSYPLYASYAGFSLDGVDDSTRTVTLKSSSGKIVRIKVSFVAILIGSRPDLSFLPSSSTDLGIKRDLPVDCKTNTVDINKLTHLVKNYDNLFAIGPLAGDNFVRFIPGGALAVVSELYRKLNL